MSEVSMTPVERARKFVGGEFHDLKGTEIKRTFNSWVAMLQRCLVPGGLGYDRYSSRGIGVCEQWFLFSNFVKDMGLRPHGKTLDRIDNDAGYSKENCRWADRFTQARNTSRNKLIQIDGEVFCQSELAASVGVSDATIMRRHRQGLCDADVKSKSALLKRKLTAEQVQEIRGLISEGMPDTKIAAIYGVSHSNIRYIRLGITWKQK